MIRVVIILISLFTFVREGFGDYITGPTSNFPCGSAQSYTFNGTAGTYYAISNLTNGTTNLGSPFFPDQYGQQTFTITWTGASGSITIAQFGGDPVASLSVTTNTNNVSVSPSSSSIIIGGSQTLVASSGAGSYSWSCNQSPCGLSATNTASVTATPSVTTVYTVTVSAKGCIKASSATSTITVLAGITGNTICCDKTICGSGDPTALGQQSGVTLSGGATPYYYQWYLSSDGSNWSLMSGATSSSYDPPVLSQTTYYKRVVNPGSSQSTSNIVTVTVVPNTISLGSTTYSTPTTIKANQTVSILGNLASTGTNQVNIKAGQGITVSPPSVISPSITLAIEACTASLRLEEDEVEVIEAVDQETLIPAGFKIYPNPITNGYLEFGATANTYSLMSSSGNPVLQGKNADKLDVTGLPKGLYLLKLDDKVEKVIVE